MCRLHEAVLANLDLTGLGLEALTSPVDRNLCRINYLSQVDLDTVRCLEYLRRPGEIPRAPTSERICPSTPASVPITVAVPGITLVAVDTATVTNRPSANRQRTNNVAAPFHQTRPAQPLEPSPHVNDGDHAVATKEFAQVMGRIILVHEHVPRAVERAVLIRHDPCAARPS